MAMLATTTAVCNRATAQPVDKALDIRGPFSEIDNTVRPRNQWALIIGAGSYEDDRIPDLPACRADALAVRDALVGDDPWEIPSANTRLLTGDRVTRTEVIDGLDWLGRNAGPEDLVVVFFSGHGAQDAQKRSYWVMHNTQADRLRATALPENEISDLLASIRSERVVTFVDSCYAAATANIEGRSKAGLVDLEEIYRGFGGKGRVAMTASDGSQLSVVLDEGEGAGYSAFSYHLAAALAGAADAGERDGVITVDEVWGYVRDRTTASARRVGGLQTPTFKGEQTSKFMLALNEDRFAEIARERVRRGEVTQTRLRTLRAMAVEGVLGLEQGREAMRLAQAIEADLDEIDRQKRRVYLDLADGTLAPAYLNAAIASIETPAQRDARLARERHEAAEAQRRAAMSERERRVDSLLEEARADDNRLYGRRALARLDDLLEIDADHAEALAMREKIRGYYPAEHLDRKTVELAPGVTAEFVYIDAPGVAPDGFLMGSPASEEARFDDEAQFRAVLTMGYWMQTTVVTQGQWQAVMGSNPSHFKNGASYPVEQVSWDDSQLFIGRLRQRGIAARLPTEAEWEFACRAGSTTPFNTGSTISTSQANYNGNFTYGNGRKGEYRERTMPVGSFAANAWGLHDMHGNVFEWCQDWYGGYPSGRATDPIGNQTGSFRVLRGGSWIIFPGILRSARRAGFLPTLRINFSGFRLTLDSE